MKRMTQLTLIQLITNIALFLLLSTAGACSHEHRDKSPIFTSDLQRFGYSVHSTGPPTGSYSNLTFLSNNLLLVVINERHWTKAIELSSTDEPPSKFLLFDIRTNSVVKSVEMPTEKYFGSVQMAARGRFVLLNNLGVQLCDVDLTCGQPKALSGPVIVSPEGSSIAVGGWGENGQALLDGSSLQERIKYPRNNPSVVPGDGVSLLRYEGHKFFVKEDGKPDRALPIVESVPNEDYPPRSRFLNSSTLAINETDDNLLIADLNGKPLYRLPITPSLSRTSVITCACETKFAVQEQRFTRWNAITHFYDIENERPYDFEQIRVLDTLTGKLMFSIQQDPRPYLTLPLLPALSPDGRHIAMVLQGTLEVYTLP